MNVTNKELSVELERCFKLGCLTDKFAEMALVVAEVLYNSERYAGIPKTVKDEWVSYFSLILVRGWEKIEAGKNIKSYLYTMAGWASAECRRAFMKRRDREEKLKQFAELWEPSSVLFNGDVEY